MRTSITLFFLLLTRNNLSFSQPIMAGQHAPTHYFIDLQPDIVIEAPFALTDTDEGYPVDLNDDGTNDFHLRVTNSGDAGNRFTRCLVEPLGANEVAFASNDSCFALPGGCASGLVASYGMPRAFHYGDPLDGAGQWADTTLYLSYNHFADGCYVCDGRSFAEADTNYLGVRLVTPPDTVYGWIKVTGVKDNSCTIQAFASESGTTSAPALRKEPNPLRLYPNPAGARLYIAWQGAELADAKVLVTDIAGREVSAAVMDGKSSVDVSELPAGTYLISVIGDKNGLFSGRFVKQ